MEKIVLTEEEFKRLERFHIVEGTIEKESTMYYAPTTESEILKVYNSFDDKLYMMNKIRTTRNLLGYTKENDFPELLQPLGIVMIGNKMIGTIFPVKDAYTARLYLNLNIVSEKIKIEILRQIGLLLEKIKKTNPKWNAAFSDVHLDNFLVDSIVVDENRNISELSIVACDTDSMKILDSTGNPAYYLCDSEKLSELEKYKLDSEGIIIPDSNTDIYCYNMILLDYISKGSYVYCLSIEEFYHYLDFLDSIGFDPNLLQAFSSLYETDKDNVSALPYLDTLLGIQKDASLKTFYKQRFMN